MKFYETEQPPDWEFVGVDGIFIKMMPLPNPGMAVPQHAHTYDHYTMLASGGLAVWADGVKMGEFDAPKPILIKAGVKHLLISTKPNTVAYCIHNLHGEDAVSIEEEHTLEIEPCGVQ